MNNDIGPSVIVFKSNFLNKEDLDKIDIIGIRISIRIKERLENRRITKSVRIPTAIRSLNLWLSQVITHSIFMRSQVKIEGTTLSFNLSHNYNLLLDQNHQEKAS